MGEIQIETVSEKGDDQLDTRSPKGAMKAKLEKLAAPIVAAFGGSLFLIIWYLLEARIMVRVWLILLLLFYLADLLYGNWPNILVLWFSQLTYFSFLFVGIIEAIISRRWNLPLTGLAIYIVRQIGGVNFIGLTVMWVIEWGVASVANLPLPVRTYEISNRAPSCLSRPQHAQKVSIPIPFFNIMSWSLGSFDLTIKLPRRLVNEAVVLWLVTVTILRVYTSIIENFRKMRPDIRMSVRQRIDLYVARRKFINLFEQNLPSEWVTAIVRTLALVVRVLLVIGLLVGLVTLLFVVSLPLARHLVFLTGDKTLGILGEGGVAALMALAVTGLFTYLGQDTLTKFLYSEWQVQLEMTHQDVFKDVIRLERKLEPLLEDCWAATLDVLEDLDEYRNDSVMGQMTEARHGSLSVPSISAVQAFVDNVFRLECLLKDEPDEVVDVLIERARYSRRFEWIPHIVKSVTTEYWIERLNDVMVEDNTAFSSELALLENDLLQFCIELDIFWDDIASDLRRRPIEILLAKRELYARS